MCGPATAPAMRSPTASRTAIGRKPAEMASSTEWRTQADADLPARAKAVEMGNTIITVSETEAAEWQTLVAPIYQEWIADLEGKGIDGQALIDEARGLMSGSCKGATGSL